MAFDSLTLSALTSELHTMLVGGKINKIIQPERDEVILNVYNKGNMRLLISANASVNRVHITDLPTTNATNAPSFCMLLRKYLLNSTVVDIQQMPFERVIDITLDTKNELGYSQTLHLIFELTGKTSNTILTTDSYTIIDSIKHLPQDLDSKRIIMAGAKYNFFEPQGKIPPNDHSSIVALVANCTTDLRTLLASNILGVSTATINEVVHGIDCGSYNSVIGGIVADRFATYLSKLGSQPNIVFANGTPVEVCPHIYSSIKGDVVTYPTLNKAHDMYYYYLDRAQRFRDKAKSTNTIVKNAIARTEKKIAIQQQGIIDASTSTINKIYGDLILANLHNIKYGDSEVTVVNCYDEQCPMVTIPLSTTNNPQNNAQLYYKKYQKQKSTIAHNKALLETNRNLLDYLYSIQQSLKSCDDANDLNDVIAELTTAGIIRAKPTKGKKIAQTPSAPLVYNIEGYKIIVGKNNLQNNELTFRTAKPHDIWVHTQSIHSSHVIIVTEGTTPPDSVIVTACQICAYYSQASNSSKVTVDYTAKSNIKKPSKARLGYVIYHVYQSIVVDPNQHRQHIVN